jgi:formamidopyrimidine-DNA glycosylase
MPELPEVEVLVRQLNTLLPNRTVQSVRVRRRRVLGNTSAQKLARALKGKTFAGVRRRGKFLLFDITQHGKEPLLLLGHLGMTGRMYLSPRGTPLPKHAAVVLVLGDDNFVFEDTRYFGKLTLDTAPLNHLGPEPLDNSFAAKTLAENLARSSQPIKIKLLDQSVVVGVGNIYASEALFRARISPLLPARRLTMQQVKRLHAAIRKVLTQAIEFGSTVPLTYAGADQKNALFYYGSAPTAANSYEERLLVYDREGHPCGRCGSLIQRIFQSGRSTFYCLQCQST